MWGVYAVELLNVRLRVLVYGLRISCFSPACGIYIDRVLASLVHTLCGGPGPQHLLEHEEGESGLVLVAGYLEGNALL